jgi:dTDP-4-dehydrorhamnose 3,5-epimerase
MRRFLVMDTSIQDLKVIERRPIGDHRGYLERLFCSEELHEYGWRKPIAQINHTLTEKKGTVRGMHFQHSPYADMKLVSCIRGAVWDVAVDLRPSSATYLKWHAQELSASNNKALMIPEGFAHGFQALSDNCELIYLHSAVYTPAAEAGINPRDPMLSITWPQPIVELSTKDAQHPLLNH